MKKGRLSAAQKARQKEAKTKMDDVMQKHHNGTPLDIEGAKQKAYLEQLKNLFPRLKLDLNKKGLPCCNFTNGSACTEESKKIVGILLNARVSLIITHPSKFQFVFTDCTFEKLTQLKVFLEAQSASNAEDHKKNGPKPDFEALTKRVQSLLLAQPASESPVQPVQKDEESEALPSGSSPATKANNPGDSEVSLEQDEKEKEEAASATHTLENDEPWKPSSAEELELEPDWLVDEEEIEKAKQEAAVIEAKTKGLWQRVWAIRTEKAEPISFSSSSSSLPSSDTPTPAKSASSSSLASFSNNSSS